MVATLLSLLGLAVVIIGFFATPRILGQVVPIGQVDEAKAEATTWKEAFEGMKSAHDGLLALQRDQQQAVLITNTVMNALNQQLPPSSSQPSGTRG